MDLLENDHVVKTAVIQKIVHKINVKSDEVEIFFFVGEKHVEVSLPREIDGLITERLCRYRFTKLLLQFQLYATFKLA